MNGGNTKKKRRRLLLESQATSVVVMDDGAAASFHIPKLVIGDDDIVNDDVDALVEETYQKYQVLHIPKAAVGKFKRNPDKNDDDVITSWKDIGTLFQALNKQDQDSWCVENDGDDSTKKEEYGSNHDDMSSSPVQFLKDVKQTGYSSFLLQKDTTMLQQTLKRLPVRALVQWFHGPCIWFFFGVNNNNSDLQGRPEHTDSVSHDGTWHYQLSGCKQWHLRPTEELMLGRTTCPNDSNNNDDNDVFIGPKVLDCQEGDILILNTRLWWHQTIIPPQMTPSVSYARDFFFTKPPPPQSMDEQEDTTTSDQQQQECSSMSNVDGLYAANDIEEDTLIFTEMDMPDCELHVSSTNPNCNVVELQDDGTSAVVSIRPIRAGEFFCVAPQDDSDDDDEEEAYETDNSSIGENEN